MSPTPFHSLPYTAFKVLESLADGVYVTGPDRRILYWNPAAARITGWPAGEMLGRFCHDNLLRHVDPDGNPLCGQEHCPLHRAMVTGRASSEPHLLFATSRDGRRVPVQVNVAPIYGEEGAVVGGVEIFRDVSHQFHDLERARAIQSQVMRLPAADDPRISFAVRYLPHGMVGGDFYTVERLDANRYIFCVADIMGHGMAAALYAMHLHSLWESNRHVLARPATFAGNLNRSLCQLFRDRESFATGIFGLIDLAARGLALVSAGAPPALLAGDGEIRLLKLPGLPLGMDPDHLYEIQFMPLAPGDGLLLCTDGTLEIMDRQGRFLGAEGLASLVAKQGFPATQTALTALGERLLRWSHLVHLPDDCTMLSIHLPPTADDPGTAGSAGGQSQERNDRT